MLSDEHIHNLDPAPHVTFDAQRIEFARAVEAEVRKQLERPAPCARHCEAQAFRIDARRDTELILQLVEALEHHVFLTRPITESQEALVAGRARLQGEL